MKLASISCFCLEVLGHMGHTRTLMYTCGGGEVEEMCKARWSGRLEDGSLEGLGPLSNLFMLLANINHLLKLHCPIQTSNTHTPVTVGNLGSILMCSRLPFSYSVWETVPSKNDGLMVLQANLLQAEYFPFFTHTVLTVTQKLHIYWVFS